MEELSLKKFEEASEKVKEVTLDTNLVFSEYFSSKTGNKVYQTRKEKKDLLQHRLVIMRRVLPMRLKNMV